jgi:hypothetical protein
MRFILLHILTGLSCSRFHARDCALALVTVAMEVLFGRLDRAVTHQHGDRFHIRARWHQPCRECAADREAVRSASQHPFAQFEPRQMLFAPPIEKARLDFIAFRCQRFAEVLAESPRAEVAGVGERHKMGV